MMRAKSRNAFVLCGLLLAFSCRAADSVDTPSAYSMRTDVTPARGSPLQRIPLPPATYTVARRADLGDIRVFDLSGRSLPAALVDDRELAATKERTFSVPAFPIVGPVSALRLSGVSLRMDAGKEARIVGASGTLGPQSNSVVGTLLDTRAVLDPVVGLMIEADIPDRQPVTLSLDSSSDLKTWQWLADTVLFRSAGKVLKPGSIPLSSVNLSKRYVRVTWPGSPVSSVQIKGALLTTSTAASAQRINLPTTRPMLLNAHDVRLSVSFGTKLDALRIVPAARDAIVPIQLFGRNMPDQPWTPLATSVLYGNAAANAESNRNVVELSGVSYRTYRIAADSRTPGFSTAPHLNLIFRPASLIVMFNGGGPFTLAAGSPKAPNVFLATKEMAPNEHADFSQLPVASVSAVEPHLVPLAPNEPEGQPTRRVILWAALALGTLVLAITTLILFQRSSRPELAEAVK